MNLVKLYPEQLFDGYRLQSGKVLVTDQEGVVQAVLEAAEAGEDLQPLKGILSPGFINCHCHLELSHLKGQIDEGTGLAGFVSRVVAQRKQPEAVVLSAIAAADAQMQAQGIVAVGDICNTADSMAQKLQSPLYYHSFVETMGANPSVAAKNFSFYNSLYKQLAARIPRQQVSLTPHAPYSVSDSLFQLLLAAPNPHGVYSIHNQETAAENEWFLHKSGGFQDLFKKLGIPTEAFRPSGRSSLQTYGVHFTRDQHWLLVHNLATTAADRIFAQQSPATIYWCFCPNANLYISGSLPDLPAFLSQDDYLVLGTDSLASNHQLSILEEIKTLRTHFPQLGLEQMLRWATSNGARALRIDRQYGSFEKGKKPGMVRIDAHTLQGYPV